MELSSIQTDEYNGALSLGLTDLCEDDFHSEFVLTEDVDFAIIINQLN